MLVVVPLITLVAASCRLSRLDINAGAERDDQAFLPVDRAESAAPRYPEIRPVDTAGLVTEQDIQATAATPWLVQLPQEYPPMVPVTGVVLGGEDVQAAVFVDRDADGRHSAGDVFIGITQDKGYFEGEISAALISRPMLAVVDNTAETQISAVADATTPTDEASPETIWRALAGSYVISPLTELLIAGALDPVEVAGLVDLPGHVDITQFDPHNATENPDLADQIMEAGAVVSALLADASADVVSAVGAAFTEDGRCAIVPSHASSGDMKDKPKLTVPLVKNMVAAEELPVETMPGEADFCTMVNGSTAEVV